MKRARLERNKGCHVFQSPYELAKRHGFGMWLVRRLRETTGDNHAVPHEDASYGWIWQASGQGQLALRDGIAHEGLEVFSNFAHLVCLSQSGSRLLESFIALPPSTPQSQFRSSADRCE